jgi:hypothetical protein
MQVNCSALQVNHLQICHTHSGMGGLIAHAAHHSALQVPTPRHVIPKFGCRNLILWGDLHMQAYHSHVY